MNTHSPPLSHRGRRTHKGPTLDADNWLKGRKINQVGGGTQVKMQYDARQNERQGVIQARRPSPAPKYGKSPPQY